MRRPIPFKTRPRRRGDEGATAVEFAMIVGPLLLLIFGIIEVAMVFIVSTTLENAVSRGARTIRTGEHQNAQQGAAAGVSRQAFMDAVCANMTFLSVHCRKHLSIDVRTPGAFTTANLPSPVTAAGGYDDSGMTFTPGGERQIVLVRAFYRWPLLTPFLNQALGRVSGNTVVLTATATFRNEPFGNL
jgi:Flp pilus assembly protein TadG